MNSLSTVTPSKIASNTAPNAVVDDLRRKRMLTTLLVDQTMAALNTSFGLAGFPGRNPVAMRPAQTKRKPP